MSLFFTFPSMGVKTSEDNCTKHLQKLLEAKKDIKFMNLEFKKLGAVMRLVGNVQALLLLSLPSSSIMTLLHNESTSSWL